MLFSSKFIFTSGMSIFLINPNIIYHYFMIIELSHNIYTILIKPWKTHCSVKILKGLGDLLQKWYRFSKKEAWLRSVKNKNKSSRYYVQGIDSVWNNKKGVVAIVGKIEEFLSFYPWIVFYVASNDISFGHKGTVHTMFAIQAIKYYCS